MAEEHTAGPETRYRSIPEMALAAGERWPEREAVVDGDVRLTFAGVAEQTLRVARALIASGIQPGDRVALWAPNGAAWIPTALGIHAAGGWLVPVNTRFKGEEAAYILGKTDAAMVFSPREFLDTDLVDMARRADPDLRALRDAIELPHPGSLDGDDWRAFLDRGGSVTVDAARDRMAQVGPDD